MRNVSRIVAAISANRSQGVMSAACTLVYYISEEIAGWARRPKEAGGDGLRRRAEEWCAGPGGDVAGLEQLQLLRHDRGNLDLGQVCDPLSQAKQNRDLERVLEQAPMDEVPKRLIDRSREEDVGGQIEQLDADPVEGARLAVRERLEKNRLPVGRLPLGEGPVRCPVGLTAARPRRALRVIGSPNEMKVNLSAGPVGVATGDEDGLSRSRIPRIHERPRKPPPASPAGGGGSGLVEHLEPD